MVVVPVKMLQLPEVNIYRLINDKNGVSGRKLDMLVTRYRRYHKTLYYIDVTNPSKIYLDPLTETQKKLPLKLIDLAESYYSQAKRFTKLYFDCLVEERL